MLCKSSLRNGTSWNIPSWLRSSHESLDGDVTSADNCTDSAGLIKFTSTCMFFLCTCRCCPVILRRHAPPLKAQCVSCLSLEATSEIPKFTPSKCGCAEKFRYWPDAVLIRNRGLVFGQSEFPCPCPPNRSCRGYHCSRETFTCMAHFFKPSRTEFNSGTVRPPSLLRRPFCHISRKNRLLS